MYNWIRKDGPCHMNERTENGVTFLTFPALEETGLVRHAFSTRMGGVSKGPYSTLNFSFTRGDEPEDVRENYRRMASALQVDLQKMVLTWQTHTTNVRLVTREDFGKGILKERDYRDVDGLITNIPGVTLVTFFADCVPLYFLDPKRKAIGLSHSGWRGTVNRMGAETLKAMNEAFGTIPEDVIACIGPSICQDCYEVSEDVIEIIRTQTKFTLKEESDGWHTAFGGNLFYKKENGRYQLNLWEANRQVLLDAGVLPEHIFVTDICTHCNPELLFSHRRTAEKRGNLCAFLSLRESRPPAKPGS